MARHLVRGLGLAAVAVASTLVACGRSPPNTDVRVNAPRSEARPAAEAGPSASRRHAAQGRTASTGIPISAAPAEHDRTEDAPPWLTELLHAPDPNVRIQGLDAWARNRGASINLVTYALVDPDESVRSRAEELFERELTQR